MLSNCERMQERLRIVHGDLNIQMADIAPMKALRHMQRLAVGRAGVIEPGKIVEAAGIL